MICVHRSLESPTDVHMMQQDALDETMGLFWGVKRIL